LCICLFFFRCPIAVVCHIYLIFNVFLMIIAFCNFLLVIFHSLKIIYLLLVWSFQFFHLFFIIFYIIIYFILTCVSDESEFLISNILWDLSVFYFLIYLFIYLFILLQCNETDGMCSSNHHTTLTISPYLKNRQIDYRDYKPQSDRNFSGLLKGQDVFIWWS
jgi:hypothetical protein